MALTMLGHMFSAIPQLRVQPTQKRIRVLRGGVLVADTSRAALVWEPRRIVAQYAVPVEDLLVPYADVADVAPVPSMNEVRMGDGPPVLEPGNFRLHTTPGQELTIGTGDSALVGAGFRPADPQLNDHVVLDWDAFDTWLEEDEPLFAHPRDPFHRVDVRTSSRPVRISADGALLAASNRPTLLFETALPTRFYVPRTDVVADLVGPTGTMTECAYKGAATYFSVGSLTDVAWTYEQPVWDCPGIQGLVAFFNERVDVELDGVPLARPITPWS